MTAPALTPRKKTKKPPLNTYIQPDTDRRLAAFASGGGYAVTDVVDLALREFLDRNGA